MTALLYGGSEPALKHKKPTVSLVLGSGGARGYAHIGVIEALKENGYEIKSISGSSIGALIGGLYAAGG
ncbi:MAG: patatin-like phospholipase family protein, partial [Sulfurimonas sp.]